MSKDIGVKLYRNERVSKLMEKFGVILDRAGDNLSPDDVNKIRVMFAMSAPDMGTEHIVDAISILLRLDNVRAYGAIFSVARFQRANFRPQVVDAFLERPQYFDEAIGKTGVSFSTIFDSNPRGRESARDATIEFLDRGHDVFLKALPDLVAFAGGGDDWANSVIERLKERGTVEAIRVSAVIYAAQDNKVLALNALVSLQSQFTSAAEEGVLVGPALGVVSDMVSVGMETQAEIQSCLDSVNAAQLSGLFGGDGEEQPIKEFNSFCNESGLLLEAQARVDFTKERALAELNADLS